MFTRHLKRWCKPRKLFNIISVQRSTCGDVQLPECEVAMDTLWNGIRVATEQTCSPLACVSLFIETGPRYENEAYNGINHFIEHLAFKGLTYMSRQQIEQFSYETGSRLDAHTSQEIQRFSITCNAEHIQCATCILCGIVDKLQFNPCEVERERDNICLEMDDTDRDYRTLVFENLIQTAFQGTTLGQRVVGSSKNVASFDGSHAMTYLESQYLPWRIVFASSAPVNNGFICNTVLNQLGCMPESRVYPKYGDTRFTGSSVIYRDDSREFAHVAVAFEAPGYQSEDFTAMLVLKHMVGYWSKTQTVFGTWPDLAARCADTELCHSYESFYLPYRDIGLWGVYFVCRKLEPEDFLHNFQNILMSLSIHMSDNDFRRAQSAAKLELFRNRAGAYNSSVALGTEIIYRGSRTTLMRYGRQIDRCLYKSDLQDLCYEMFYNTLPVMSAAGPTENVPDYNRLISGQYWIRW